MKNNALHLAVQNFAHLFVDLPDEELERAWTWKDHNTEGIRFAFFVTLQELRQLNVTLSTLQPKPTPVQHILSQYHAAYMDLQATVLGLSDRDAERIPAEGEWQVRKVYAHVLGADFGFTATIRYALELHRAKKWTKGPIPESEYPRLYAITEEDYDKLMEGPLSGILTYHRDLHNRIIEEFSSIQETELDLSATFWEETQFPIRHRLHRYEAHIVQHTVQIDKTLTAIGQAPNESKRLLRRIYAALADAESTLISTEKMDDAAILGTASSINERTMEIESILRGN